MHSVLASSLAIYYYTAVIKGANLILILFIYRKYTIGSTQIEE